VAAEPGARRRPDLPRAHDHRAAVGPAGAPPDPVADGPVRDLKLPGDVDQQLTGGEPLTHRTHRLGRVLRRHGGGAQPAAHLNMGKPELPADGAETQALGPQIAGLLQLLFSHPGRYRRASLSGPRRG